MNNYVGNPLQIRGAEKYVLQDGKGDGMHFLYVRNGLGLEAWISLDRAGDISRISYKGDNYGYFSPCGYVSPSYYDHVGSGFLKSFTAGFFTTCGLTAVGSPCVDDGDNLPLHGTVSHIPAQLQSIIETEKNMEITLIIRDTTIFGRKLILKRIYNFSYTDNNFEVNDSVTNEADIESPYMILYHCNLGYPLVSENSTVVIPNTNVIGRDDHAQNHIESCLDIEKPQANYQERCYYFDVKAVDNTARVGIFNDDIKKGLIMDYSKDTLPCFTEWKMMGKTDYVLGLEPGNCTPDGRDVLRKNGKLKFLQSGESKTTTVRFSYVDGETFKGAF